MAVAVKNATEGTTQSPMDRLAVRSLLGVAYVLAALGLILYGIPAFWAAVIKPVTVGLGSFVDAALLGLTLAAAVVGAVILAVRLVGPSPPQGLRPGVFSGLVGLALAGLATWVVGNILDSWFGASGIDAAGQVLLGLVGLGFLYLFARWFFKPGREDFFVRFEEQGWFDASTYKKNQGLKVRRGTMVGILLLVGTGIYTLISNDTLVATESWQLPVPFTGTIMVKTAGDTELKPPVDESGKPLLDESGKPKVREVSRTAFRQENERVKNTLVRIQSLGDSKKWKVNDIVKREDFETEQNELEKAGKKPPTADPANEAEGTVAYRHVSLLPHIQFTVPLLMAVAGLWFAYRVVNFPAFADFLIATEAELNKVSWTSQKRLIQDTIVVLVTVVLLTLFLLVVDFAWYWLLSRPVVGVLPPPSTQSRDHKEVDW